MSAIENKKKYIAQYKKKNLKRVPLDMQIWQYDRLKAAAEAAGESVNGYIKKSISMRIEADRAADHENSHGHNLTQAPN